MITIGIQGGPGSFSDQAAELFSLNQDFGKMNKRFLYTSNKVLSAINHHQIDYGIIAIWNTVGGMVEESLIAMGCNQFAVHDFFPMSVIHCLMCKPGKKLEDMQQIFGHPQAIKQCKRTLRSSYGTLSVHSQLGDAIDPSRLAHDLFHGVISAESAIIGSRRLAEIFELQLLAEGINDDHENTSHFVVVKPLS